MHLYWAIFGAPGDRVWKLLVAASTTDASNLKGFLERHKGKGNLALAQVDGPLFSVESPDGFNLDVVDYVDARGLAEDVALEYEESQTQTA